MTTCLTVLYDRPTNAQDFVRRYREEHIPLANRILRPHGLRRWHIQDPLALLDNADKSCCLIVTLEFDSDVDTVMAALGSDDGQRLFEHALSLTDASMHSYLSDASEQSS